MSRIERINPGKIYSDAVDYHGFVFLRGMTAKDTTKDIKGQTADILAQIDAALEERGTDKTRILSAQIWLSDITLRDAMNEVWTPWVGPGQAPARACVESRLATPAMLVEIMVVACK
ncbi:RidA family protein [Elioraea sp.]|uniref:RidA family protein n=1 Tax=Elioraea sp. TaxID=2185103 RepID=UPI0025BF3924|nr:RidA family protein [Elioraea sp.]